MLLNPAPYPASNYQNNNSMKSMIIKSTLLLLLSIGLFSYSEARGGYYHHNCHHGYNRYYSAPQGFYGRPHYHHQFIPGHWSRGYWGARVWIPGHYM